jgi:hypothetical protein
VRDRLTRHPWRFVLASIAAVALLAVAGCVAVAIAVGGREDVDREAYVRKNLRLLAGVPTLPGASRLGIQSEPWAVSGNLGSSYVAGYSTVATYKAPPAANPEDVTRFYEDRLLAAGWRLKSWGKLPEGWPHDLTGDAAVENRCYGGAAASICINEVGLLNGGRVFTVSVDHLAYLGRPVP